MMGPSFFCMDPNNLVFFNFSWTSSLASPYHIISPSCFTFDGSIIDPTSFIWQSWRVCLGDLCEGLCCGVTSTALGCGPSLNRPHTASNPLSYPNACCGVTAVLIGFVKLLILIFTAPSCPRYILHPRYTRQTQFRTTKTPCPTSPRRPKNSAERSKQPPSSQFACRVDVGLEEPISHRLLENAPLRCSECR